MAEKTLQQMARGGMFDHIGGGFHRYSVDEHWHVPHFEKVLSQPPVSASFSTALATFLLVFMFGIYEKVAQAFQRKHAIVHNLCKHLDAERMPSSLQDFEGSPDLREYTQMLYDNGQLAATYLDAFCLTGNAAYARVARGILDYMQRDMTHPDGGIFSAEVPRLPCLQCYCHATSPRSIPVLGISLPFCGNLRAAYTGNASSRDGHDRGLSPLPCTRLHAPPMKAVLQVCLPLLHAEPACAQDADSLDKAGKKAEGAYYVWTADEIDEVLGADTERGRAFKRHYYVKVGGNVDLSPRR